MQVPRPHHPEGLLLAGPLLLDQLGRLRQPPRTDAPGDEALLGQVGRSAQASGEQERGDFEAGLRGRGLGRVRILGVPETADEAPFVVQRGEDQGPGSQGRPDDQGPRRREGL